ncbi:MAG TPA: class I lanthipeptide [Thermoanaerobaculia bacterium]
MKKTVKKLALSRETLRNLNEEQLENVGGAEEKSKRYSECPDLSCGIACTYVNCTA